LSASRAASVLALFAQAGVQPERMTILGHGEFKPVADNDSPEGRNANRRVVIFVRALGADELPANNFVGRPTGTVGG
jgi:chemotaxis protein MotB